MQTHPKLSLIEHFQDLPDPRVRGRCDHDLMDVLVIANCTLLCGGTGFSDMADFGQAKDEWCETFLTLRNGIPSSLLTRLPWPFALAGSGYLWQLESRRSGG